MTWYPPNAPVAETANWRPPRSSKLARLHRRSRTWHPGTQILWWLVLLPVALAAFAGTQRSRGVRVGGYLAAAVLTLIGIAGTAGKPPTEPSPAPLVAVAATSSAPITTAATSSAIAIPPAPASTEPVPSTSAAPRVRASASVAEATPPPVAATAVAPAAPTIDVATAVPAETSASETSEPAPSVGVVHAGSYCSTAGAVGVTSKGTPMVCAPGSDGRLRWRSG